jgi:hypothetical protein
MLASIQESHPAEKANHARISEILSSVSPTGLLATPKVVLGVDDYITEITDQRSPLWYQYIWDCIPPETQEVYSDLLTRAIRELAKHYIFLSGVQVYLQTDGTLRMLWFGEVHHDSEKACVNDLSTVLPPSLLAKYC